jgi:cysteine desulfuration protein SufE
LPLIDPKYKTDDFKIKGCQSQVWLHASNENGKIRFTADSDAIITKGIIALLVRVFDNESPEEIAQTDLQFINDIGLAQHLSPTRSNGLLSMIKQMKLYAVAFISLKK